MVNILGNVTFPNNIPVKKLTYTLNEGFSRLLSTGPDYKRLALPGDFNIEIDTKKLMAGKNTLTISAVDTLDNRASKDVTVNYTSGQTWSLPYSIDWRNVECIQDVAQIVDGKWKLVEKGLRTAEPYYDRIIAIGDMVWKNYEVTVIATVHGYPPLPIPLRGNPYSHVPHSSIAVRWQGHYDDGNQPRVKWFPLGTIAEFRLGPGLRNCIWVCDGGGKDSANDTGKD